MKILLIGNPISSGGNAKKRIKELAALLDSRGHETTTYLTQYAGDGKKHMSKLKRDIDRIVVVGGDGTLNEIINGIPGNFSIPLLQLPTGNANLFGTDLCLPQTVEGAADLVEGGKIIMADIASMNDTKFIMVAGFGFDANVTEEVKKHRKGQVNNLSYIMPVFRSFKKSSALSFTVTIDEKTVANGAMVLISNVKCYAGICEVAYDAGVNTGVLDIVIFPKISLYSLLRYFIFAKVSKITKLLGVQYFKGKKIQITSDDSIPVEVDGDFVGRHEEVIIKLFPQSIPVIVPMDFEK